MPVHDAISPASKATAAEAVFAILAKAAIFHVPRRAKLKTISYVETALDDHGGKVNQLGTHISDAIKIVPKIDAARIVEAVLSALKNVCVMAIARFFYIIAVALFTLFHCKGAKPGTRSQELTKVLLRVVAPSARGLLNCLHLGEILCL